MKARYIFEEAIETVTTARDFSLTFDSYAQFEEACIAKRLELSAGGKPSPDGTAPIVHALMLRLWLAIVCIACRGARIGAANGAARVADRVASAAAQLGAPAAEPAAGGRVAEAHEDPGGGGPGGGRGGGHVRGGGTHREAHCGHREAEPSLDRVRQVLREAQATRRCTSINSILYCSQL